MAIETTSCECSISSLILTRMQTSTIYISRIATLSPQVTFILNWTFQFPWRHRGNRSISRCAEILGYQHLRRLSIHRCRHQRHWEVKFLHMNHQRPWGISTVLPLTKRLFVGPRKFNIICVLFVEGRSIGKVDFILFKNLDSSLRKHNLVEGFQWYVILFSDLVMFTCYAECFCIKESEGNE